MLLGLESLLRVRDTLCDDAFSLDVALPVQVLGVW